MAATCDPQTLAQQGQCLNCGVPTGMQWPVVISLLCQIAGMNCDPATLMAQAQCINCGIPPGMQLPVMIYLLCQINAGGGGGGGGTAQLVTYTSGTPANPPNVNNPAIAYDPTGNLPTLGWTPAPKPGIDI